MKTFIRILWVGMALLLVSGTVSAQTPTKYTLIGATDCGRWLNQQNETRKAWLLGFLSGQNLIWVRWTEQDKKIQVDPLGKLNSADQAYVWMDNYCRTNPLKTVANGAEALFIELVLP